MFMRSSYVSLQHEGKVYVLFSRSKVSTAEFLCSRDVVERVSEKELISLKILAAKSVSQEIQISIYHTNMAKR